MKVKHSKNGSVATLTLTAFELNVLKVIMRRIPLSDVDQLLGDDEREVAFKFTKIPEFDP